MVPKNHDNDGKRRIGGRHPNDEMKEMKKTYQQETSRSHIGSKLGS
jgi:hypothetical protein